MKREFETSRNLVQQPRYKGPDSFWVSEYLDACQGTSELTWDPAALLSFISYGYVCGDRTLFSQVKRRSWMSDISDGSTPVCAEVPPHQFYWMSSQEIAKGLIRRLCNEAERACADCKSIYVLTSGGLDSRIVAGILHRLFRQGRIPVKPISVTWGMEGSRDVVLGRMVAESLGFAWEYVSLNSNHLIDNIQEIGRQGALVSPIHLHRMTWFRDNVSPDALVLAASYGDSVGRAEFSGRMILELPPLQLINRFGLLKNDIAVQGKVKMLEDLFAFRKRLGNRPEYAKRECEYSAYYMRGLIAQSMSVIDLHCNLYQMFTDPEVYSFMWSLHPSTRNDVVYGAVLNELGNDLDRIPWARTNRTLDGRVGLPHFATRKDFHDYTTWIQKDIRDFVNDRIDPDWFGGTGIFNTEAVAGLLKTVDGRAMANEVNLACDLVVWLISLRTLVDNVGGRVSALPERQSVCAPEIMSKDSRSSLRCRLSEVKVLGDAVRNIRKRVLRYYARFLYPPIMSQSDHDGT